jgi:hypothetical protein
VFVGKGIIGMGLTALLTATSQTVTEHSTPRNVIVFKILIGMAKVVLYDVKTSRTLKATIMQHLAAANARKGTNGQANPVK